MGFHFWVMAKMMLHYCIEEATQQKDWKKVFHNWIYSVGGKLTAYNWFATILVPLAGFMFLP